MQGGDEEAELAHAGEVLEWRREDRYLCELLCVEIADIMHDGDTSGGEHRGQTR